MTTREITGFDASEVSDLSENDLESVSGGYGERTGACLAGAALGAEGGPLGMLLGCAAGLAVLQILR